MSETSQVPRTASTVLTDAAAAAVAEFSMGADQSLSAGAVGTVGTRSQHAGSGRNLAEPLFESSPHSLDSIERSLASSADRSIGCDNGASMASEGTRIKHACPICLDSISGAQAIGCLHIFCRRCIARHCKQSFPRCPVCQRPIPPEEQRECMHPIPGGLSDDDEGDEGDSSDSDSDGDSGGSSEDEFSDIDLREIRDLAKALAGGWAEDSEEAPPRSRS